MTRMLDNTVIKALERTANERAQRLSDYRERTEKLEAEIERLGAENAALHKDKARLDYLIGLRRPYFSQRNGIVALIGTNSEGKRVVGVGGNAREAIDSVHQSLHQPQLKVDIPLANSVTGE